MGVIQTKAVGALCRFSFEGAIARERLLRRILVTFTSKKLRRTLELFGVLK
jgi:hypothetical protein